MGEPTAGPDGRGATPSGPGPRSGGFATADELRAADFNLSASRWRPQAREQIEHRDPLELLDELKALEAKIAEEIEELTTRLREGATA